MLSKKLQVALSKGSAIRETTMAAGALAKEIGPENVFDFSIGNPATPAPKKFAETIKEVLDTVDSVSLNSYMDNSGYPEVREAIAEDLNERFQTTFDWHNITMSVGAGGAMNVTLMSIIDPGDEVIVFAPYFSEYDYYITNYGGVLSVVAPNTKTFQPDLIELEEKINEKTKAIIVNSPNNPSGVVYSEDTIQKISAILEKKQKEYNKEIYMISDEPYRELLYDGAVHTFVTKYYDNSFVCYSYSKSLSLPGERIGYIAVSNEMKDADDVLNALKQATRFMGFVNAPSLMQRAVKGCIKEKTDLAYYAKNRQVFVDGLAKAGFEVVKPEGAFYIFMKAPIEDDIVFCKQAQTYNLFIVPGSAFSCPGYVRIAYCNSLDKVERSIDQFVQLGHFYGMN